jgi:hypothetical protein
MSPPVETPDPRIVALPAAEIRRRFVEFFAERGHAIVPSAGLVPAGDATLLFTNSGMVPFKNLLTGEAVYLEYEPGPSTLDKYGRTLAYLYRVPDGLFINLEIIREGYGHAYTRFPFQYMELFRFYEGKARESTKGLWADDASAIGVSSTGTQTDGLSPENPSIPAGSSEVTVYGTRTGSKYHRDGCRYLSKSKIPMTLKQAKERGLTPCSVCNPPK